MPKMNVVKSINVKCTIEEAYKTLMDFKQWLPWSPWLILEKDVKLEFKEEDRYYKWTGKLVGSGEMTIEATEPNKAIYYNLTFLKPWKSKSKVSFKLRPSGSDETTITWTMDGSLPFFMFWMKKMMQNYIGMDYERGLRMLKNYLEDGKVHSELEDNQQNHSNHYGKLRN